MGSISLDSVALGQLHGEQKALLDAIDDLRKHGVGRFVDLPQIIVVGDQSSGKSSVLEAISRVRFPVKNGLCTRFATELILRTDHQTKVDVRIQPSTLSNSDDYQFNETRFDKDDLPRIIEAANNRMLKDSTTFSEDVLRIEISSPDVPHLTLVDLPGFYHSEDENQSAVGRQIVDRLVESYIARKNSIVLAIVSARNQVILQKVLSKVKIYDKNKERTLGIITKPDLLSPCSKDEESFLRLARNLDKSHQLSLGWHVLRNRDEIEGLDSHEERDRKEKEFFESGVWSGIPSKDRGAGALRHKLSTILLEHIGKNLPGLITTIEENVNDRQDKLKRLGQSRTTPRELRSHLSRIASEFQIVSSHAIEGNYIDDFFGGLYCGVGASTNDGRVRKLRALIRDLNRAFAYVLATKGSRRIIMPKVPDDGEETAGPKNSLPPFLEGLAKQYDFPDPVSVTFDSVTTELEAVSAANQGNEFPGTENDRIAVKLFQDQSQPWEKVARRHLDLVLQTSKSFVEKLIRHIVSPDKTTITAILTDIVDPFFERKSLVLEEKLQELLYHYRSGYLQPLDSEFRSLLVGRRKKNLTADVLQDLLASRPELFTEMAQLELAKGSMPKNESEFGVEALVEKCETYYEMSLRTFTDNVIVLASENCLVRDLPSILTTEMVNQMEDDELKRLATESPSILIRRAELQEEYEALKKGLQVCNRFRAREETIIPLLPVEPVNLPFMPPAAGKAPPSSAQAGSSPISATHIKAERSTSVEVKNETTQPGEASPAVPKSHNSPPTSSTNPSGGSSSTPFASWTASGPSPLANLVPQYSSPAPPSGTSLFSNPPGTTSTAPSGGTSLFGMGSKTTSPAPSSGTSLFDNISRTTSTAPSGGTGLFGSPPTTTSPAPSGGLFWTRSNSSERQSPAPSLFPGPTSSVNGLGSNSAPLFGSSGASFGSRDTDKSCKLNK